MKKTVFYSFIIFSILLINFVNFSFGLEVVTEEFPPYNFTSNGKITGVSTEIVESIMKKAGVKYTIKSLPWARAYNMALKRPEVLIYTIGRTKAREKLFKWVGVIVPSKQSVFALKTRKDIKILNMYSLKKYRIGTTINDFRENYLIGKGFEVSKFNRSGGKKSHVANYRKLKKGSIDVWPMPETIARYISKEEGDNPNEIMHVVHNFKEISKDNYHIAASLSTNDVVIQKLKKSLEEFKQTEDYTNILKKWNIDPKK